MGTSDDIVTERHGAVAVVTLNRPHAMNALSASLRAAFGETMRMLGADAAIRAVVLTGAGGRAFCAGLDLKELGADDGAISAAIGDDPHANPVAALATCRRPVIAAINGVAVTGGLELALACDMLVCAPGARFADTHVKVGVLPGWGLPHRLARLIGPSRAKEMSLTGRFVDAAEAYAWGLVNRIVPAERLLPHAIGLAAAIAGHAPAMVARYRGLIDDAALLPPGEALALERSRARAHSRHIRAATIDARREAVRADNRADPGTA